MLMYWSTSQHHFFLNVTAAPKLAFVRWSIATLFMLFNAYTFGATYYSESQVSIQFKKVSKGGIDQQNVPADLIVQSEYHGATLHYIIGNAGATETLLVSRNGETIDTGDEPITEERTLPDGRTVTLTGTGYSGENTWNIGDQVTYKVVASGWANEPPFSLAFGTAALIDDLRFINSSLSDTYSIIFQIQANLAVLASIDGPNESAFSNAMRIVSSPGVLEAELEMVDMSEEERREYLDTLPLRLQWEIANSQDAIQVTAPNTKEPSSITFDWSFDVHPGQERSALIHLQATGSAAVVPECGPLRMISLCSLILTSITLLQTRRVGCR